MAKATRSSPASAASAPCSVLGRTEIPAQVRDQLSDRDMMEMALIENLQRVQLNPIEEAMAFESLINECGVTHEEIAEQLGKSRSAITNTLRLLKLDPEVRAPHPERQADRRPWPRPAAGGSSQQLKLARKIVDDQLNVRSAEQSGAAAREEGEGQGPSP